MRAKAYKTGGNSPWEDTFNYFNQRSAYFTAPFVTSYTECNFANLVPSCHSCVQKSTFCLARSIGLPSKKVFKSNTRTHKAEKSRNLVGVIKEKENNKYENQIEIL